MPHINLPRHWVAWCFAAAVCSASVSAGDALHDMVSNWSRQEYSYSYFIPVVAVFFCWQRLPQLLKTPEIARWVGPPLVLLSFGTMLAGELGALYTIVQYGYLALFLGLVVSAVGLRRTRVIWASLACLFLMVPLPNFLYANLSQQLQLLSSAIGAYLLHILGVSVFLNGNIIDLGPYQLQVAEACSGLRYLFPLMSFGFIVAYLFKGRWWQRVSVLISTVPISVLMNSARIALIGVLVDVWGQGMAEGLLHYFEGWIVFLCCLALLLGEVWLFYRFTEAPLLNAGPLDLRLPTMREINAASGHNERSSDSPLLISALALVVLAALTYGIGSRGEAIPERDDFLAFPLIHNQWLGRDGRIETALLDQLNLTDYLISDYRHPDHDLPVNLYVAYYASQRKGASVHSPRSCIPGGGWVIEKRQRVTVDSAATLSFSRTLPVNRVLISKGKERQLVYYWFQERGRLLTNEYLVKWYLFWDALTRNRTDGALVRLVVPLPDGYSVTDADAELRQFIGDFRATLDRFIPS